MCVPPRPRSSIIWRGPAPDFASLHPGYGDGMRLVMRALAAASMLFALGGAAIALDPARAFSLYGRGMARG